jgi:hypothetical protein
VSVFCITGTSETKRQQENGQNLHAHHCYLESPE